MTPLKICRVDDRLKDKVSDEIEASLLASLATINTQSRNESIVLAIWDDRDRLLGGLTATTSYGWLLVKTLWVDNQYRASGIGRRLMERAENEGLEIGCHAAWLDTSNSEAHAFYLKLGYSDFGILENASGQSPENHKRWFMKKPLYLLNSTN